MAPREVSSCPATGAAATVAVLVLLLVGFVGPSAPSQASTPTAPHGPAVRFPFLPTHLQLPKLRPRSTTSPTLAGAMTSDPMVLNNLGMNTTVEFLANPSVPSGMFLLTVETDVLTATTAVSVGIISFSSPTSGPVSYATVLLPNGTLVVGTNALTVASLEVPAVLNHRVGDFWDLTVNSVLVSDPGLGAWANGTFDLGTPKAIGLLMQGGGVVDGPQLQTIEFGGSFALPLIEVPWAMGFRIGVSSVPSYRPVSANAVLANATSTIGIEGQVQVPGIQPDQVIMGGGVPFPGLGAQLWGNASFPIGGLPQLTVAAYTNEWAVRDSQGLQFVADTDPGFHVLPFEESFVGAVLPVNSTISLGIGMVVTNGSKGPVFEPFYTEVTPGVAAVYESAGPPIPEGTAVTFAIRGDDPGGWWNFSANGTSVHASAAGNGSVYLGHDVADTVLARNATPANASWGLSAVPMIALGGNASGANISVTSAMLFPVGPPVSSAPPDFALAWRWTQYPGIYGHDQQNGIPNGSLSIRTDQVVNDATDGVPLWSGLMKGSLLATTSSLYSNETSELTLKLTGGTFAPPEWPSISATVKGAGSITNFTRTATPNEYTANFTAPVTLVATSSTVSVTVSDPDYSSITRSAVFTVLPNQVMAVARADPSVVVGGSSGNVTVWVNDSTGAPISGASLAVTGAPTGWVGASHEAGPGVYYFVVGIPALQAVFENLTLSIFVNRSGLLAGVVQTDLEVVPAPLLAVQLTVAPGTTLDGGDLGRFNVNVTEDGLPVTGAAVLLGPVWAALPGGSTAADGVYSTTSRAPNATVDERYTFNATATSTGFRPGYSTMMSITVRAAVLQASITPNPGTVVSGGAETLTVEVTRVWTSWAVLGASVALTLPPGWPTPAALTATTDATGSATFSLTAITVSSNETFPLSVHVTLPNHVAANATVNVTVTGSTPSPTNSGGLGRYAGLAVVGAILVLIAVLVAFLYLRRRPASKKGPGSSSAADAVAPAVAGGPSSDEEGDTATARPPAEEWEEEEEEPGSSVRPSSAKRPAVSGPPRVTSTPRGPASVAPAAAVAESPSSARDEPWPMVPLTLLETRDPQRLWAKAAASGTERDKMLVISPELPGKVAGVYGLAGATVWRLTRIEGENNLPPADVDRVGHVIESHFSKGSARTVVLTGIEKIVDAAGLRSTVRLLEVVRDLAETTRGAVLLSVNPELLKPEELRQLEEGATVLR